jgi:hypothetical protein
MRLVFPGIEAVTHEEAARIASGKETYDAMTIEGCDGLDYSAVVDLDGDEDYDSSQPILLRADGGEIEPTPDRLTNRMRAAWAEAALSVFIQHTGCDREDALGDLLCDLMHWSEQNDFDFDLALDRAQGHFEAEIVEEGEVPPPRPGASPTEPQRFRSAATPLLAALTQAVAALNTAPRFTVPSLDTDSYAIAALCDRAIAKANGRRPA